MVHSQAERVNTSFTAPSAPSGTGKEVFYRPELDVLRFFAFLLVFIHHSFPAPEGGGIARHLLRAIGQGSALGVPLFFLLSAYLITELLFREKRLTQTITIRDFYVRRVLRIWPLYFAVLGFAVVVGYLNAKMRVPLSGLVAYLLLAGNWWTGIHGFLPVIAGPLWSISVEEQFYLLWPAFTRAASRRWVFIVSVLVWVSSQFVMFWLLHDQHANPDQLWTNSFIQFQYFALGALLAVAFKGRVATYGWVSRFALCTFGLICILAPEFKYEVLGTLNRPSFKPGFIIYSVAGVGVVAIFCAFLGAKLAPWSKGLAYLGRISYGLYMFHLAFIIATLRVLESAGIHRGRLLYIWFFTLPLVIFCAHLSYQHFERPFLKMKQRWTVVRSREG